MTVGQLEARKIKKGKIQTLKDWKPLTHITTHETYVCKWKSVQAWQLKRMKTTVKSLKQWKRTTLNKWNVEIMKNFQNSNYSNKIQRNPIKTMNKKQ